MRSSEARSRNPLGDVGRMTSKTLKFKLGKQVPPLCPASTGEAPDKPQPSLLYSQQLWAASGHVPQRLTCDRQLYYPELAVAAPVLKQLPVDSAVDVHQGKRAKLAGGLYRRSFRETASACDSSPPGTPYRPNRQQQQHVSEDQGHGSMFAATSSSSSHELSVPRQQSSCTALTDREIDNIAWPIVVPTRQKRSSRVRRVQWQQWPPVLQQLKAAPGDVAAAATLEQHQHHTKQRLLSLQQQQPQQQQPLPLTVQPVLQQAAVAALQLQQDLQQQPPPAAAGALQLPAAGSPLHKVAVQEIAAAFPSAASVACVQAAAASKAAAAAAGGDGSPGQETSQSSDMTMCRESPRGVAGVALSSWPSSSTESECQVQPQQSGDAHKAAAGKRPLAVSSVSPESPSSPLHHVF